MDRSLGAWALRDCNTPFLGPLGLGWDSLEPAWVTPGAGVYVCERDRLTNCPRGSGSPVLTSPSWRSPEPLDPHPTLRPRCTLSLARGREGQDLLEEGCLGLQRLPTAPPPPVLPVGLHPPPLTSWGRDVIIVLVWTGGETEACPGPPHAAQPSILHHPDAE